MKYLLCAFSLILSFFTGFSQSSKVKSNKYPSLLWEISGKGLHKPSYLFGTMHVSSKMVFNLSDSFYLGIRNAQVVALETNPATWQEDFSRYETAGEGLRSLRHLRLGGNNEEPQDYLTIGSLRLTPFEKQMEAALSSNPSMINNFLYRTGAETSADFEEDTYLDLHIFQAGKKLGKKVCGVEDFDGSMQLVREAYADAAKEKNKQGRGSDYDEDFSYRNLEEAYRSGNLDLLDTINKVNSQSAAFDEKFLYRRNEIQAHSIDSILKKGATLFVGVGAAHLPGNRGVIELLRRAGYTLRPIKMRERDSHHKDAIERLRVPVQFARQTAADGFYTVNVPGKLYSFGDEDDAGIQQYADMTNGSYYTVSRVVTNAALLGQTEADVLKKIDSVLYENVPGKILTKRPIVKNGYRGFEITNRTRRGDYQRYNIFVTPFEIIVFKMSGNGDYVKLGTEAEQFFNSIQLKERVSAWKKFRPSFGGFEAEMPQEPQVVKLGDNWQFAAVDAAGKTAFAILRTDIHNHSFVEEDSFDLRLMEESFASSDFVQRQLSRTLKTFEGFPALDAAYRFKDSSVALVRFVIQGPHYYTILAKGQAESKAMRQFLQSFSIKPFVYGEARREGDTALYFTVKTPVPLEKKKKMSMYPENIFSGGYSGSAADDDSLVDNGRYVSRLVDSDSTGEKIFVSFFRPSAYYRAVKPDEPDTARLNENWRIRRYRVDTLHDGTIVSLMDLGAGNSSRMIRRKTIERSGLGYEAQAELDTLSSPSAFITGFFESFAPADSVSGVDVTAKKSGLFFAQLFSSDTLQHKKALLNIGNVAMDSADFPQLKKAIASLGWKEKKYLESKKELVSKLADIPQPAASDFLKALYTAAGDTVELQYTVLETLLQQQTSYAYKTFAGILENDPPVLDMRTGSSSGYSARRLQRTIERMTVAFRTDTFNEDDMDLSNGSFIDNLSDSLQLTAGIYKSLLPLMNLDDYEQPLMDLTATLLDSSLIAAKDYDSYLPKLLIEARQTLKKQVIKEKAAAIEKAQQDDEDKQNYNRYSRNDDGNDRLTLYATLLLPFWDRNPQVLQIVGRMLASNDERLKYNTAILLLRNSRPLPDTLLAHFAASDDYRYTLYDDLKQLKKLSLFPAAQRTQEAIARSQLLNERSYNKPDTLAFLQKVPLAVKDRRGYVYVFKYKENKADNSWKLATVGLLPSDTTLYTFDENAASAKRGKEIDFTEVTSTKLATDVPETEQVQKLVKKLLYSKRKSAAQFYSDDDRQRNFDLSRLRL